MVKMKTNRTLYSYDEKEEQELAREISETMYRYDQLAEQRIAHIKDVTDDDIKRFLDIGYLVIDQVIEPAEIKSSIEALMDILSGESKGSKVQFVGKNQEFKSLKETELAARKVSEYIDHEPRLRAIAYNQAIMDLMERIFKEKAKVVQDQAILKPPTGGAEKPWHQDMAYGNLAYDKAVAGAWIALDPAELDNGCMHVIPYSHRDGGVPHYAERDWQICDTSIQVNRDIAVPLNPGGVLIFSGLLHHGTPPNFSVKRRRALQIHYAPDSAVKLSPQEYKRMFTNEMTGAEC